MIAAHPHAQAGLAAWRAALARYARSPGLWILMLIAPIGARFMIPTGDTGNITIAIGKQLPVLTAPVIGVCLGITVSTLLLPLAYIYLRSNTNRRQPWQILDVMPGTRVARTLGRFGADLAVLALLLAVLNAAGLFLAQIILPDGLGGLAGAAQLSFALWLIVAPALAGLAAIRALLAAVPVLRGAGGDIVFFILWMTSLVLPAAASDTRGFAAPIYDFPGFTRPLLHGTDPGNVDLQIGAATVAPGRRPVDAMAGLMSPGYPAARAAWVGIALLIALFAGLVERPHRARRPGIGTRLAARIGTRQLPAVGPERPAGPARIVPLAQIVSEARLIAAAPVFVPLLLAIAAGGLLMGMAAQTEQAALLLLVFGVSAQAGRMEGRGLAHLIATAPAGRWPRRLALVAAAGALMTAMLAPAALAMADPARLMTGIALAAGLAAAATGLAMISRSAFAPRLILLIIWYGYVAA